MKEKCELVGSGLYHRTTCGYGDGNFVQGLQAKLCFLFIIRFFSMRTDICSQFGHCSSFRFYTSVSLSSYLS